MWQRWWADDKLKAPQPGDGVRRRLVVAVVMLPLFVVIQVAVRFVLRGGDVGNLAVEMVLAVVNGTFVLGVLVFLLPWLAHRGDGGR